MRTIVSGRIVASETEFVEAALGHFVPTAADLADFAEFVADTSEPARSSIDAENISYLHAELEQLREQELKQLANIVPMPRRGTTRLATKGARAA